MPLTPEQDKFLDDEVDRRQVSYSQVYEEMGLTPPSAASVSADAIEARNAANDYYTQEFRLTGPINLSEEQIAANAVHFEAIRQANQKRTSGQ